MIEKAGIKMQSNSLTFKQNRREGRNEHIFHMKIVMMYVNSW